MTACDNQLDYNICYFNTSNTSDFFYFRNEEQQSKTIELTVEKQQSLPASNARITYTGNEGCDDGDVIVTHNDKEIKVSESFQTDSNGKAPITITVRNEWSNMDDCRLTFDAYDETIGDCNTNNEIKMSVSNDRNVYEAYLYKVETTMPDRQLSYLSKGSSASQYHCYYKNMEEIDVIPMDTIDYYITTQMLSCTKRCDRTQPTIDISIAGDCSHLELEGDVSEDGRHLVLNEENKASFKFKVTERDDFECIYRFTFEDTFSFDIGLKSYSQDYNPEEACVWGLLSKPTDYRPHEN